MEVVRKVKSVVLGMVKGETMNSEICRTIIENYEAFMEKIEYIVRGA